MNYKMNRLLRVMLIICITILLSVHNLCAQEVWEELAEQLMDEDENSSFQWDTHFEELSELRENPININTATKEQLERFPFLSDQLVENILTGRLFTIYYPLFTLKLLKKSNINQI